jgi:hypothetical protein
MKWFLVVLSIFNSHDYKVQFTPEPSQAVCREEAEALDVPDGPHMGISCMLLPE